MEIKDLLGESYREGMTLEEVSAALKDVTLPDLSGEVERLKNALNNANSDAKKWKDQFRATQDEATRQADEARERSEQMLQELNALKRANAVAGYKASYITMGYDDKAATEIAGAIADGDMTKVLRIQQEQQKSLEDKIRKDLLKGTPKPAGGEESSDETNPMIRIARELGKQRSEVDKQASDILSHYIK